MPRGRGRRPRHANPVAQPAHRGNRRRAAVIDDDELVCQNAKDKIWNFEYIDLALILRSNFNNQHNGEDTIGLNNDVLVIQKKAKNLHAINTIEDWTDAFICICSNHD
jgi:hypothetical protein